MVGQGGPLTTGVHLAAGQGVGPVHPPGHQVQPGPGIHLDHVRRGATGVPRPLNTLHRPVWRDADFQRPPRRTLGQLLQGEADCRGNRLRRRSGRVRPPYVQGLQALGWRDAAAGGHEVHGGIPVRAGIGPARPT